MTVPLARWSRLTPPPEANRTTAEGKQWSRVPLIRDAASVSWRKAVVGTDDGHAGITGAWREDVRPVICSS